MSKMYVCPECDGNYVCRDVNPEPMCNWCADESPAQKEIKSLQSQLTTCQQKLEISRIALEEISEDPCERSHDVKAHVALNFINATKGDA